MSAERGVWCGWQIRRLTFCSVSAAQIKLTCCLSLFFFSFQYHCMTVPARGSRGGTLSFSQKSSLSCSLALTSSSLPSAWSWLFTVLRCAPTDVILNSHLIKQINCTTLSHPNSWYSNRNLPPCMSKVPYRGAALPICDMNSLTDEKMK